MFVGLIERKKFVSFGI